MSELLRSHFSKTLLAWQAEQGRHHLPWQYTGDAYKTWLSEVMLQQTQVSTVLGYYARFLEAFPTVVDLANAQESEVMALWQGLGYYSRARNLHRCAQQVRDLWNGRFPETVRELETLPGVGRSTAGAIASLAHGVQAAIMDGNVKRVFCRLLGIEGYPEQSAIKKQLWAVAEAWVPEAEPGRYNQALMDLGATVCTPKKPACHRCPFQADCAALRAGKVHLLPTPKPKAPRPHWYAVALKATNPLGQVWLRLQGEGELWRGLWMLPFVVVDQDAPKSHQIAEAVQLAGWPVDPQALDINQPWVVHELTHRKLHFRVFELSVLDAENLPVCETGRWVDPQAVATPKIVEKLLQGVQVAMPNQDVIDFG